MSSFQIFNQQQIDSLIRGGKVLRECLDLVSSKVEPGISTAQLDAIAEEFILSHEGATPAFKGYHGYPATLCTSVNEECVHGLPGKRVLQEGDIIALDCGVLIDGLYTDACVSVGVGGISEEAANLLKVTEKALEKAVGMIREGVHIGDISAIIQHTVESGGFAVIPVLTGHGLGTTLHQFPNIPNEGEVGAGPVLPANTIIAIEPIVCAGTGDIADSKDGWTLVTSDSSLSAHFEHTLLVQSGGCKIIA